MRFFFVGNKYVYAPSYFGIIWVDPYCPSKFPVFEIDSYYNFVGVLHTPFGLQLP